MSSPPEGPSSDSSPPSPPSKDSPSPPSKDSPSPPSPDSPSPPSKDSPSPPSSDSPSPPSSDSPSPPSPDSPSPPSPDKQSPPPSDDTQSPPPPSDTQSPPPPSDTKSPPPPSGDSPTPPSGDSPTPPSDDSPTPPPPSDNGGNGNSTAPSPGGGGPAPPRNSPLSPPPPKSKSPKEDTSTQISDGSSGNKNGNSDSDSNHGSIVAGVTAGIVLLVIALIVIMVRRSRRKKRKARDEMKYYMDNNPRNNNNYYNGPPPKWQQNNGGGNKMHSPGASSENPWQVGPPPPPPAMMSSSDLSSAGFSGPYHAPLPPPHPAVALGYNQSSFTYEDLAVATNNFAQENLLGQGGFGYVHKGVLPNGKEVAVKSLKANSGQGEREFQAEVDIISRVHHKHLVSLVGYCIAGTQRMLVYEFVPNGTLEYHLHGPGCPPMDWPSRMRIALGAAKGFAYLHEDCHPRIIHRDIKAANILLEENFEAKVADFGLAKLSSDNFTHVSTRIMGTFGYLAPEYASSGKLTDKSDVYSFGIMLLELITGRRPIDIHSDDDGLVDWARPIMAQVLEGGSYEELVDPKLGNNYNHNEMLRMVLCAAACIRHSARRRPKTSQIVRALEGEVSLDDLDGGIKTAEIALFGSSGGSETDLKRLGRGSMGLSSQEFSSDDGNTGELVRPRAA